MSGYKIRPTTMGSIAMMIGFLASAVLAPTSRGAVLGDVNGDGRVSVADALQVLGTLTRLESPTPRERVLGNVVNWSAQSAPNSQTVPGSFGPGLRDVVEILRIAVGILPATEVGPVVLDLTGPEEVTCPLVDRDNILDGPAMSRTLYDPWDLVVASSGDVYFTEWGGSRVRVLDTHGKVRTIAGDLAPDTGYFDAFADGVGSHAHFHRVLGIAFLPDGNLVVADYLNFAIRKVTLAGVVSTIAGGARGYLDGRGRKARMSEPNGIASDPAGDVYVADTANQRIRKIDPDGNVTTLAGDGSIGLRDGPALQAQFNFPTGVSYDPRDGGVFVADMNNHAIRKISAGGTVTTLAGNGSRGYADGYGSKVRFHNPYGIDLDPSGRLWIADWENELVRVMELDGRVWTYAGSFTAGHTVGPVRSAKFYGLMNVRIGPDGAVYMAETDNERLGMITP